MGVDEIDLLIVGQRRIRRIRSVPIDQVDLAVTGLVVNVGDGLLLEVLHHVVPRDGGEGENVLTIRRGCHIVLGDDSGLRLRGAEKDDAMLTVRFRRQRAVSGDSDCSER